MDKLIVLIGPPGAGKTTCGQFLAATLGWAFVDTDAVIEAREGIPVSRLFAERGEPAFRDLETETLQELLQKRQHGLVIGTGGGIILREKNRKLLSQVQNLCYLQAQVSTLVERVAGDRSRPLLQTPGSDNKPTSETENTPSNGGDSNGTSLNGTNSALTKRLETLLGERADWYAIATHKFATENLAPQEIAQLIVEHLKLSNKLG